MNRRLSPRRLPPRLLRQIVDLASEALVVADEEFLILYANQGASRIFGWPLEELVGAPLEKLLPTSYRETHGRYMTQFAAGGTKARLMGERSEVHGVRRNGEEFPAEISITTTTNEAAVIYAAVVRDVTKRRAREAALQRSEARLRSSQRIARMGSWDLHLPTNELYWSEEVYRIFGLDPDEFECSYQAFLDRVHPEDLDTVKHAVDSALETGSGYMADHRIVLPNGTVRYVHEQAETIYSDKGEPMIMEGIVQDITGRKLAERALLDARNEALEASAAKSRFLATMSHELRTPLNAIIGFSQMIGQEVMGRMEPEVYRSYVSDIHASGQHLLGLVDCILDAAMIDAGRLRLSEEWFPVAPVVCEAVSLTDLGRLSEQGRITVEMDSEEWQLFADRRLYRQILLNLCNNALKYSPVDAPVGVSLHASGRERHLAIEISDQGDGMTPEGVERATQPFVRLHDAGSKDQAGGLGLGLYLARTFIEAHGGRLELDSRPGEGTTARVVFPAHRVRR